MGRPRKKLLPSPDQSSFGIWLVTQMNANHLAIKDVVDAVGISYSVLYSWVRGDTSPRLLNLIEVVDLLSQHSERRPFDLLSEAIITFPEAVYAQKRWTKRNRPRARQHNLDAGLPLYTGTDEHLMFIPFDRVLAADIAEGAFTGDADPQGSVMSGKKGATLPDHDIFSLTTNKNCNVGE